MKKILISNCDIGQVKNKIETTNFEFGGILYQQKEEKTADLHRFSPKTYGSFFHNSFAPAFLLKIAEKGKDTLLEVSYYIPLIQKIFLCLFIFLSLIMQILLFIFEGRIIFRLTEELVCYLPLLLGLAIFFAQSIFGALTRYLLYKKIKMHFENAK